MARRRLMSEALRESLARELGVFELAARHGWGAVPARQCGRLVQQAVLRAEQLLAQRLEPAGDGVAVTGPATPALTAAPAQPTAHTPRHPLAAPPQTAPPVVPAAAPAPAPPLAPWGSRPAGGPWGQWAAGPVRPRGRTGLDRPAPPPAPAAAPAAGGLGPAAVVARDSLAGLP